MDKKMDFYSEAKKILNSKKKILKPEHYGSQRQLKRELLFWSSLYNVKWANNGIKKEIDLVIEYELDKLRKYKEILSKY